MPPPDPAAPAGQFGFRFDRSGMRVPALAISAWIPERTVVNEEFRHTSVLRTLRERWSLGPPSPVGTPPPADLAPVLSLDTPRTPADWPEVAAQPVPAFHASMAPADAPMTSLQKGAFFTLMALGQKLGHTVPDVKEDAEIKGAEAIEMIAEIFGHLFPGLRQP